MTNALISTVVAAAATFIAAGFVIQFALGGSQAAQEELRGGVKINNVESMQQLIMYDSLVAYNCDDTAGGNLDATGNKDWDDWKTYKKAAELADTRSRDTFTFQDLNNSFSGNDLKCYGTSTSIGGRGIINDKRPSSREWRNDQEGEHSRIRFTVNETPSGNPIEIGPCFWFNQYANVPDHNPNAGWSGLGTSGGITDMVYHFTDSTQVNRYDPYVDDTNSPNSHDCSGGKEYTFTASGGGQSNMAGGPMLTVTVINTDFSNNLVSSSGPSVEADVNSLAGDEVPGPDTWGTTDVQSIQTKSFELCEGTRGYVQTNTGFTDDQPNVGPSGSDSFDESGNGKISYQDAPNPNHYDANDHQPGVPDKEKFSDLNDRADNSIHPFIVIEKYTC